MRMMWAHATLWGSLPFIELNVRVRDEEGERNLATMNWKKMKSRLKGRRELYHNYYIILLSWVVIIMMR